ncbi:hypothetical protein Fmac_032264 [Flemingia macrophylla]|uniref:UBA domain-containing protein n=1 Tax=Flemingia macrophylla TaxID=520843 RepID=A0ABD1L4E5_9FABA
MLSYNCLNRQNSVCNKIVRPSSVEPAGGVALRPLKVVMVRVNSVSGSYILCCDSYGVKYVASSSAVLANSKVLDHFVGMGFSREMVSKVIQEYGEENEAKLLEELLTYTDIEKNISDSENDDTLWTLVKMGYKQEEALIAIERLVIKEPLTHNHRSKRSLRGVIPKATNLCGCGRNVGWEDHLKNNNSTLGCQNVPVEMGTHFILFQVGIEMRMDFLFEQR